MCPLNSKIIKVFLITSVLAGGTAITGCASLALGESEFSCPLTNDGAPCASSWKVYEMSHDGRTPAQTMKEQQQQKLEEKNVKQNSEKNSDRSRNGDSDYVTDNFVTPRLPNEPIPVRTPPTVMRIWIAPYEDKEGDFIMSGYVYTEVSPRRWTLGVNAQDIHNSNTFTPLEKE